MRLCTSVVIIALLCPRLLFSQPGTAPTRALVTRRVPAGAASCMELDSVEDYAVGLLIDNSSHYFPRYGGLYSELFYDLTTYENVSEDADLIMGLNDAVRVYVPAGIGVYGLFASPDLVDSASRSVAFFAMGFEPKLYGLKYPFLDGMKLDLGTFFFNKDFDSRLGTFGLYDSGSVSEAFRYYYPFVHFSYDLARMINATGEQFKLNTLSMILNNLLVLNDIRRHDLTLRDVFDIAYDMEISRQLRLYGQIFSENRAVLDFERSGIFMGTNRMLDLEIGVAVRPFQEGYLQMRQEVLIKGAKLNTFYIESDRLIPLPRVIKEWRWFLSGDYCHWPLKSARESGFNVRVEGYRWYLVGHFVVSIFLSHNMEEKLPNGLGCLFSLMLPDEWGDRPQE